MIFEMKNHIIKSHMVLLFIFTSIYANKTPKFQPGLIFSIDDGSQELHGARKIIKLLNSCDSECVWEEYTKKLQLDDEEKLTLKQKDSLKVLMLSDIAIIDNVCEKLTIKDYERISKSKKMKELLETKDDLKFQFIALAELTPWEKYLTDTLKAREYSFSIGDSIAFGYDSLIVKSGKIIAINQFGLHVAIKSDSMEKQIEFSYQDIGEMVMNGTYAKVMKSDITDQQKILYESWKTEKEKVNCFDF